MGDSTKSIVSKLKEDYSFAVDWAREIYTYSDGVYKPDGKWIIRAELVKQLGHGWSIQKTREVTGFIQHESAMLWEAPPLDRINVKNGLVKFEKDGSINLYPHSAAFMSSVQLPIEYKPDATCPAWEQFIQDVFPEDSRELAYEIPAWLLTPDNHLQKALLLLGRGCNGKSLYLTGLSRMLGSSNVSNIDLALLVNDKFMSARLLGKLANICADIPSKKLEDMAIFKQITGGDSITAQHKGRDSFEYTPFCRLVFSANELPVMDDHSEGLYRRWAILPFPNQFEDNPDKGKEIERALMSPTELSGLFNKALAVVPQVLKLGFSKTASMLEAQHEFRVTTDPLATYLDNTLEPGEPDDYVTREALREGYNETLRKEVKRQLIPAEFGKALKKVRNWNTYKKIIDGKEYRVYFGIRFKRF